MANEGGAPIRLVVRGARSAFGREPVPRQPYLHVGHRKGSQGVAAQAAHSVS